MPKYLIERDMPNIAQKSPEELQDISRKTVQVINNLNQPVYWLESFITDNKVYAVYISPNEDLLKEHSRQCGLPITKLSQVHMVADPSFVDHVPREQFRPSGSTKSRG